MEETNLQRMEDQEDYSNVTIRPYNLSDVESYMEWATDENVYKFSNLDPTSHASLAATVDYFLNHVMVHPWYRAICLNNRAIGEIVMDRASEHDSCRAEVGYCIGSKYWGKGITTRAMQMAVTAMFDDSPGLERLQAVVHVDNRASLRVLEKVGFERECVLKRYYLLKGKLINMVQFSLLRWHPPVEKPYFTCRCMDE